MVRGGARGGSGRNNSENGHGRAVTSASAPKEAPPKPETPPSTLSARFAQMRQDSNSARQSADRFQTVMARRTNAAPVTQQQRQEVIRGALASRGASRGVQANRGIQAGRGNGVERGFIPKRGSAVARGAVIFAPRGRGALSVRGAPAARGGQQTRGLSTAARGRGRGGRRGAARGRGRGGSNAPLSKEDLDKALDDYMNKDATYAASKLDAELDAYMEESKKRDE